MVASVASPLAVVSGPTPNAPRTLAVLEWPSPTRKPPLLAVGVPLPPQAPLNVSAVSPLVLRRLARKENQMVPVMLGVARVCVRRATPELLVTAMTAQCCVAPAWPLT